MKPTRLSATNLPHMKLLAYLLIALALGYALAVFLDPSFPDILEIIDNPKF